MSNNHLHIESLDLLIKAVATYRDELEINKRILINAANVCDQAMGSDEIVKKKIARLEEALVELEKTIEIAEKVIDELIADKNRAIDIVENS